jgi:hypothetical protein
MRDELTELVEIFDLGPFFGNLREVWGDRLVPRFARHDVDRWTLATIVAAPYPRRWRQNIDPIRASS